MSNANRARDVGVHPWHWEQLPVTAAQEDAVIQALLNRDAQYPDDLPYWCWPAPGTPDYNSNSYVAGLLDAVQLAKPAFPMQFSDRYAGWLKPVPSTKFGVVP